MVDLKDKYDVVVIGAGLGGLACGALLAKAGLSVLVAEQGSRPGGYCASFQREGFTFDAGVDSMMGCEKGGAVYDVLDELGLSSEIEFMKLTTSMRIIGADYDIRLTTIEALADELKKLFPSESSSIDAFLGECKALASEMAGLMGAVPDLMSLSDKLSFMMKFLFKCPRMRKYSGKSADEVFKTFFQEPKLRAIFGTIVPFGPEVMAPLVMNILGGKSTAFYPKGGAQALADVFARGLVKHGGDLALETLVTKVLVEDGKAAGVELADGKQVRSRWVVSNADGRQTFLKLVGDGYLPSKFVKDISSARLSGSAFLVSLGVDLDLRAMGFDGATIHYNRSDDLGTLFSADPEKCRLSIMMHSLRDLSQAPEGKATVQLFAMLPYDYMGRWGVENDAPSARHHASPQEEVADRLAASAERIIPDLAEHTMVRDIATPLTFERRTLNSEGASMGWFPAPGSKMRGQETPIRGLYQAGAWTSPGPSIYMVVQSGRNAAQLVLKDIEATGAAG